MFDMFSAWQEQAEKFQNGEITKEEYDNWRYNYPESVAFSSRKEGINKWQQQNGIQHFFNL